MQVRRDPIGQNAGKRHPWSPGLGLVTVSAWISGFIPSPARFQRKILGLCGFRLTAEVISKSEIVKWQEDCSELLTTITKTRYTP
jgi:hypothetical protein